MCIHKSLELIAHIGNGQEGHSENLYHCFDCKQTMVKNVRNEYQVIDGTYFTDRFLY